MTDTNETSVSSSPPAALALRAGFSDFDELTRAIEGWGLDWVQLDRGPLEAQVQQVGSGETLVSRFSFDRKFHQRGTSPPGVRTFGLYGKGSPGLEWRDREGRPDEIVVFPSNDEFDAVSQPGFFGDTVSVVEDRVRAVAEILELPDPLADLPVGRELIETDPGLVESMRASLDAVHEIAFLPGGQTAGASTWAEGEFELVESVVRGIHGRARSDGPVPDPTFRHRALSRALDYIDEHAALAPTVEEICRASGASWRTLDYAFKDRFDLTPKRYLQAVRLLGVRRELMILQGAAPVSATALRWGFWHMSQFAADYRRTFGELPSETVRGA